MSSHRSKLIENFLSLSVLKAADYVLPLVTIPYLVRVLGPEKFGLVAFAQAFIQYFIIFTDYGFDFSTTKDVSINRRHPYELGRIFSSVLTAKLFLTVLSFLCMLFIIVVFDKFRQDALLYVVTFGAVLGKVLFPQWYFQGMEKMKLISLLNIAARLVFVLLIFVWVRSAQDYRMVNLCYSLGLIFAGLAGQFVAVRYFGISYGLPSIKAVYGQMKAGYYVFLGQVAGSLYTTSNVFILGLLTNNILVGYYSAGEKMVKAVQSLFNPVSQTVFPHISYLVSQSKASALAFIRKLTWVSGGITLLFSLGMLLFAPQIVALALGAQYEPSINVIRILSFLPFVCALGNIFGTQLMINFGLSKYYAIIIFAAGIFNLVAAFVMIPSLHQNGLALAVMTTETLITITMLMVLEMKRISPRRRHINELVG